jgi:N-acetylglucosaminyl-diphospho-decaprenol L-rhamnosyltransferase
MLSDRRGMTRVDKGMDPLTIDRTQILVLNYNGRDLLAECLPSIALAAAAAPVPCGVTVVDNDSRDDSIALVKRQWPSVRVIREENRGLASFNRVLPALEEPVVFLLNNDVKLARDAVAPLLRVFEDHHDALFSAPQCWTFDGRQYEGMRTRVRSRFGLVQGMSRVPGFETRVEQFDLTAAAGPVLAVDRRKFLAVGGYDPVFFPGRIEDLDLGFRGWMAGYRGYYEPRSFAYHRGLATFAPALGLDRCDSLAVRNSFVFAWKNLAGSRLLAHLCWVPPRLAYWLIRGRVHFARALFEALTRWGEIHRSRRAMAVGRGSWTIRQEGFFHRFQW